MADKQSVAETAITFCDLPVDVLLKVFSLLPLRTVLQLEHLSQVLYRSVSAYLTTLKALNLYHKRVHEDVFKDFTPQVAGPGSISDDQFAYLLDRCPNVTSIVYLPETTRSSSGLSVDGIITALTTHSKITRIIYCNSACLSERVFRCLPHITVDTLALHPLQPLSVLPTWNVRRLEIRGGTIDGTVPNLPNVEVIELLGVTMRCGESRGQAADSSQGFPKLKSFSCSVRVARAFFGVHDPFTDMLMTVVSSPSLTQLTLSLEDFSCLEAIAQSGGLVCLRTLVLSSSGFYTASLQQQNYAGAVAEFCDSNAHSLEHLSLPSSILVKRFFQHFISKNRQLPELSKLEVNGIADTKLFLAPGNLVEKRYYQQFLGLCPKIASLSLHAYSGSLSTLSLPFRLTQLTLPWDNRLHLQSQQAAIYTVVDSLPNLERLSLAGVEEVEGVMQIHSSSSRDTIDLKFACESLTSFTISNVCNRSLDLSECKRLSEFALHCCPALKRLRLPSGSMKRVLIYNPSLPEFLPAFLGSLVQGKHTQACHLHIQLHAIANDHDARPFATVSNGAFTYISSSLKAVASQVDYCILKQSRRKRLEHNSGEPMYACTEFQGISTNDFSRSQDEIRKENIHRSHVLEGIRRWLECLSGTRSLLASKDLGVESVAERTFDTLYCEEEFRCCMNVPWMVEVNKSRRLTQPSSPGWKEEPSCAVSPGPAVRLNIPQLNIAPSQIVGYIQSSGTTGGATCMPNPSTRPLVFISIMEYLHNVHTLFFYTS